MLKMSVFGDTLVTDLRYSLLNVVKEPIVFDNMISNWEILSWDMEKWASKLGDKKLPFRVGVTKATPQPQWEHKCQQEELTLHEFVKTSCNNDVKNSKQCKKWWYFDYKYMHEWFREYPEILQTVDWAPLGFPELGGAESTLWLGSGGAHTPCHMDVYGCNLVAQVLGRKQWYLFPPTMTDVMLPTRIPYEESSIYSMHNFYCPSVKITQDLSGVRVVTLEPGQVLFVPRHWWHYVENLDTAVSINTWISLPADDEARVEESLVRLIMAMACRNVNDPQSLLNPNEVDLPEAPLEDTLRLVRISLERYTQNKTTDGTSTSGTPSTAATLVNTTASNEEKDDDKCKKYSTISKIATNVVPTCPLAEFQELLLDKCKNATIETQDSDKNCQRTLLEECLNAFCHPTVIAAVRNVLLETDKQINIR